MSTSYIEKVKRIQSSSFVGYWPLDEQSGTVAYNHVYPAQRPITTTPAQNGTSVGLVRKPATAGFLAPDGSKCAQFDGSVSYIDMIATLSSSASTTGSMGIWAATDEVNLAGTTKMVMFHYAVDGDYLIDMAFDTTAYRYTATHDANSAKTSTSSLVYNVDGGKQFPEWHHFGMDFVDGGSLNFYVDGVAQTPGTSLGTWSGSFGTAVMTLGSDHTTLSDPWIGWLAHHTWHSKVLTADEWDELAKAGP